MKTHFDSYLNSISQKFTHEETSEMGYRTDFEILIQTIFESINVKRIDHDPKASKGNKPDFIVMKYDIPILYIEVKDIGVSLDKIEKSEQMARYFGYANLVLTDYVEFRFYRNGQRYEEPIIIADFNKKNRTITSLPGNFEHLAKSLTDFAQDHKEPIKNGLHLAKIMGGKAQRIRDNLLQFLSADSEKNSEINKIFNTLKKLLVHDLKPDAFADMYAQTLVYGLFVARYHDQTPDNFSRQEARELVPASNPFLRHFFDHIVGPDFDKRLEYIVDELCEVFSHANVPHLMKQYFKDDLWGKTHEGPDPVIHFYEDFLREYDPNLRKKLGAYYTPQPVVRFIVRSVDYLLKKEFGLHGGLADTTKTKDGIHKVQILDPAVGTGTFLSAVIRNIYLGLRENGQIGRWPAYVHNDLLPRLHGFEIMMAPYTIAHLKLSMAFKATGFKHFNRRLGIYLTNSLEEADTIGDLFTGFGFAESIAEESKEANQIKTDTPIMVVIGNPPYSVSSTNKGDWILNLIKDYKKDLNERNIQPLSDDYIKFVRFAEHFVEKNKTGIVAMITNNSFLDGIIHRQMRKHLLETFDEIYVLDLHGNSKKKETAPDGSKDENVFDIMQGVAITIMIKKTKNVGDENLSSQSNKVRGENLSSQNNSVRGEDLSLQSNKHPSSKNKTNATGTNFASQKRDDKLSSPTATVKFAELYGKRSEKFKTLNENDLKTIKWEELENREPEYFFINKGYKLSQNYNKGILISTLFKLRSSGIQTEFDEMAYSETLKIAEIKLSDFTALEIDNIATNWGLKQKQKDKIRKAKIDLLNNKASFKNIHFKPFDKKVMIYTGQTNGLMGRPRYDSVSHLLDDNVSLILMRSLVDTQVYSTVFISDSPIDKNFYGFQTYFFPLYLYSEDGTKTPNLNQDILEEIEKVVGKTEPEEILDYIYAVLHSPTYRDKYKEFLKIDFPRVPYPKEKKTFKELVKLGTELRLIHLLESPKVSQFITTFPEMGSDIVEKPKFDVRNDNYRPQQKDVEDEDLRPKNVRDENFHPQRYGDVWINAEQYFGNVPEIAWNFYIGGYQPAQKWLKDRKTRTLTNEEIEHYQKIIVALTETDRIMKEIDKIDFT